MGRGLKTRRERKTRKEVKVVGERRRKKNKRGETRLERKRDEEKSNTEEAT